MAVTRVHVYLLIEVGIHNMLGQDLHCSSTIGG